MTLSHKNPRVASLSKNERQKFKTMMGQVLIFIGTPLKTDGTRRGAEPQVHLHIYNKVNDNIFPQTSKYNQVVRNHGQRKDQGLSAFVQKAAWDQTNVKREESPNSQKLLTGKVGEANLMTVAKMEMGFTQTNSEVSARVPMRRSQPAIIPF